MFTFLTNKKRMNLSNLHSHSLISVNQKHTALHSDMFKLFNELFPYVKLTFVRQNICLFQSFGNHFFHYNCPLTFLVQCRITFRLQQQCQQKPIRQHTAVVKLMAKSHLLCYLVMAGQLRSDGTAPLDVFRSTNIACDDRPNDDHKKYVQSLRLDNNVKKLPKHRRKSVYCMQN